MIIDIEVSTQDESILLMLQEQVPDNPSWNDVAEALRRAAAKLSQP